MGRVQIMGHPPAAGASVQIMGRVQIVGHPQRDGSSMVTTVKRMDGLQCHLWGTTWQYSYSWAKQEPASKYPPHFHLHGRRGYTPCSPSSPGLEEVCWCTLFLVLVIINTLKIASLCDLYNLPLSLHLAPEHALDLFEGHSSAIVLVEAASVKRQESKPVCQPAVQIMGRVQIMGHPPVGEASVSQRGTRPIIRGGV